MGRAVITGNIGGGLYEARPLYNLTKLESEIAKLQSDEDAYASLLLKAQISLSLLRDDLEVATTAKNAVIEQWKESLLTAKDSVPPAIEPPIPDDPETGLPWEDPDRSHEGPLLDLINTARTDASIAALTRNDDLDDAMLGHLRYQSSTRTMGHFGLYRSKPHDRVGAAGYSAETVIEILAYGAVSHTAAYADMLKNPDYRAALLSTDVTAVGIAYRYATDHPYTHLWGVLLAKPGTPPAIVTADYPDDKDPVKDAAAEEETALDKIEVPSVDPLTPQKIADAVGKYAIAANKVLIAENQIKEMLATKLTRLTRIEELEDLKADLLTLRYDVWAAFFNDEIAVGTEVYTAEVPGYFLNEPVAKQSVIYAGIEGSERTVSYIERSWNIVLRYDGFNSKLSPITTLSAEMAYYNAAIEAGHLKWKPAWRYGIITDKPLGIDVCSVAMNDAVERKGKTLEKTALDINQATVLENVPISYPPCNGAVFAVDDEVLIRFVGFDQTTPEVVGFRRAPKRCVGGSWNQIV